jgi:hypothetical protein
MWSINVTPGVTIRKRVMPHVVVCVEIDVRNVVCRIAYEDVVAVLNDVEIFVIRRIVVRVVSRDVAPVRITIDVINRM